MTSTTSTSITILAATTPPQPLQHQWHQKMIAKTTFMQHSSYDNNSHYDNNDVSDDVTE